MSDGARLDGKPEINGLECSLMPTPCANYVVNNSLPGAPPHNAAVSGIDGQLRSGKCRLRGVDGDLT